METLTNSIVPEIVLDEIVEKYKGKPGMLLSTLEEVQEKNPLKFLPGETLSVVSQKLNIPYTQVYSVATFYSFFNLKPQGKHSIIVCRGTACHTKGSKALLDEVGPILGFKRAEDESEASFTTPDNEFTIKTVACFGQCAQSPVVAVDGIIHSNVNSQKLIKILTKVKGRQPLAGGKNKID
ncbi:MAG TPA: NAD(P)H-dependent oxidoreductase subunit E [Paludibacter sp.]|jgi:NADH-quinone oxidoreductase subunit E